MDVVLEQVVVDVLVVAPVAGVVDADVVLNQDIVDAVVVAPVAAAFDAVEAAA